MYAPCAHPQIFYSLNSLILDLYENKLDKSIQGAEIRWHRAHHHRRYPGRAKLHTLR